jgi:GLPGLI family protein
MKRWIFLMVILVPIGVFSQITTISIPRTPRKQIKYEVIDTGVIRVFYELLSVVDPEKQDRPNKNYIVLEIGETGISRFYSDNQRLHDSIMDEFGKTKSTRRNMGQGIRDNSILAGGDQEVFKNYPSGKITVTDKFFSTDYLYEDNLNEIQWQIETDTATVLSYLCQKATTDFYGRHFEAWFAPDLPVNDGPWKFRGLPGLILSIQDAHKHYRFQAIGLENSRLPINFPHKDYLKTSRKEVNKIHKRFAEDPKGFITNIPGASIKEMDEYGTKKNDNDTKFSYNPIELK